jgi:hypothetical protein
MIIPDQAFIPSKWTDGLQRLAAELSMEYDIFITAGIEYSSPIQVFFLCKGHRFENLDQLKRALKLKAFL